MAGIPTHTRSLSPTQAHLTPAAVREALRRYSFDTAGLRIVDAGDAPDPDAVDATAWVAAIEAELLIAIGGDNSATVPVALGARRDRTRDRRRPSRPAGRRLERLARCAS